MSWKFIVRLPLLVVLFSAFGFNGFGLYAQSTDGPLPQQPDSLTQAPGPKVTPVDSDDEKPATIWHFYDRHGNPLDTPVLVLAEDTVKSASAAPIYPAYSGLEAGINFADAILTLFGQKYASYDLWAKVSVYNWFFPAFECGIGYAESHTDKQGYGYKTKPSLYAKLGFDYNFLYKSKPDYKLLIGFRAGWSSFSYDITDITVPGDYWQDTLHSSLTGLKSTAFYGEALLGLEVKIAGDFSLGWNLRWHFPFHISSDRQSHPWFVPGYGGENNFGVTVSAIWNLPSKKIKELSKD